VSTATGSPPGSADAFPRHEAFALIGRLPAYARLAWRLGRDPQLSPARRGAVLAAAAYLVSPIDVVPGIIPLVGQLDDLLVVLLALRIALSGLPVERRLAHLEASGMTEADLAADIDTLGLVAAWLARRAAHLGLEVSRTLARASVVIGRRAARMTARGVRSGAAALATARRPDEPPPEPRGG
jgi:uncharacterized membrane protein YkvA (DUF1232 family)